MACTMYQHFTQRWTTIRRAFTDKDFSCLGWRSLHRRRWNALDVEMLETEFITHFPMF